MQPSGDRREESHLAPGTTFARYQIVRLLGEGGMGVVYEALHVALRKRVAIKVLKPELARDEMARVRFVREGEAAARVRHAHVVDVSDVGNHDGMPFLVMEFLEGEELEGRLRRGGRFELEGALDVLLPVIAAVAAGHDQGVIHRDLKPQNIFLARQASGETSPKVLDFGVSKLLDPYGATVNLTVAGAIYGTVQYMAPEQADGSGRVDPRSDQYALAAILSESLTGQRAFPGDNLLELLRRICAGDFPRPRTLRPDLSPALEESILRAMSLDPQARFPSLYAFGHALLPFASLRARVLWEGTFATTRGPAAEPVPSDAEPPSPQSGKTLPLPPTPGGGTAVLQRTREFPPDVPPASQTASETAASASLTPALARAPETARTQGPARPPTPPRARGPASAPAAAAAFTFRWWKTPAVRIAAGAGAVAIVALALTVGLARRDPPPSAPTPPTAATNGPATATTTGPATATATAPAPITQPPPHSQNAAPTDHDVAPPPPTTASAPPPEAATAPAPPPERARAAMRPATRAPRESARPAPGSPARPQLKRAVLRTRNHAPVTD